MAAEDATNVRSSFEQLSKGAYLDILLPRASDFDAPKILQNGSPQELSQAPARRNLYFDENTRLTLILKTPANASFVRALLPSLTILVAAHATDAVPQGSGNAASASGKHDLTSVTTPAQDIAHVLTVSQSTYVIWTPTLHLSRPRARLQRPAIYFTAHLTVSTEARASIKRSDKDFLTSFEPLPANVLEPLQFDPVLSNFDIHLSETRITKVAPTTARSNDDVKPIRGASKRAFPAVPALFTRIRYSALPEAVMASLHLEASQVIPQSVSIKDVKLQIPGVTAQILNPVEWPREFYPGDETILLYKLTTSAAPPEASISAVSINIEGEVVLDGGPNAGLDITWQAQVDLRQTIAKPTYKWSRPLSGSMQNPSRPSLQANSRPTSFDGTQKFATSETGITFSFSADRVTYRGQQFVVRVQCINHTNRSRRFTLVILQPKGAVSQGQQQLPNAKNLDPAADLFHAPTRVRQKPPSVLDLNPDIRIGPLPPGACYELEMKFRALTTGLLNLGVIRIVDLDSRQTVDVKELPDIVALDNTDEELHEQVEASLFPGKSNSLAMQERQQSAREDGSAPAPISHTRLLTPLKENPIA